MMPIIELDSIRFTYPGGTQALRGVSTAVESGTCVAIVGQNGAGKTTLIKMINALLRPNEGTVKLFGEDIRETTTSQIARKVGFVFQNPRTQIFLGSVEEEAAFGPQKIGMNKDLVEERVNYSLELVGLSKNRQTHPYELTPADRKLLTIASIISMDPQILILDEPTGGLDSISADRVVRVVESFLEDHRTVITVTHDMDFVARCFQRVVVMNQGLIVSDGPTHQVFADHELLVGTHLEPTAISLLASACGLPRDLIAVPEMVDYLKSH